MSYTEDEASESLDTLSDDDFGGDFANVDVPESPTFTVTDLLTSLGEKTQDPDYLVTKGNDLVVLLKQYPYIKDDLVFSAFGHRLQNLLTHPKKEVVATGYRICRFVISNAESVESLISLKLDVLIIISLAKGASHEIEREHALKLARKFIDTPGGLIGITKGVANAVLSVAEQIDDKLRNIAIETVCEISLLRPDLISPQNLLQYIIDGPYEYSSLATTAFLHLLNTPAGREYISVSDILTIISPFTEFPVKGHINNEKLQNNLYILSRFFKNLSGLHGLLMNGGAPLKDLVSCLTYPVNSVVSKLLDLILDVLLINQLPKRPQAPSYSNNRMALVPLKLENVSVLSTQYLAYVLVVLLRCEVVEKLFYVLRKSSDDSNSTKAGFILTEMFNLVNNIVPDQLFEGFFSSISDLKNEVNFNLSESTKSVFFIEKLTRKSNKGRTRLGLQVPKKDEKDPNVLREYKNKINYNADDAKLKQMINDTKVLSTKTFSKWNVDLIIDIFNGPFQNGKRLDEVHKTTKFVKRLISFFRPFKQKFSTMKRDKKTNRFIRLGCEVLEGLLGTPEGRRLLKENKLIPQIAECLAQVDPFSGLTASDQIFSKHRIETTLSSGYFKMLGVLSNDPYGIKILEHWKIFTIIYHISDDPFRREDLLMLFMDNMKFKVQGHSRILLSKLLHCENLRLKLHAINILSKLVDDDGCFEFACEFLVLQLYDQDQDCCLKCIEILNMFCDKSEENLNHIIKLQPSIEILKAINTEESENLIMKFLSTTTGFQYLESLGIIEREFEAWTTGERYLTYSKDIETIVSKLDPDNDQSNARKKRELPLNFFGELVKTEEGFNLLIGSGILNQLVDVVRYYANTVERNVDISNGGLDLKRLKACLWSIGFIGTSDHGIETLDVDGVIEDVVKIAEKSPLIDVKGCAFFVLGLISSNYQGMEILDEMNWLSKLDVFNKPIHICLPGVYGSLIGWDDKSAGSKESGVPVDATINEEIDENDEVLKNIFKLIGNLCNHVFLNSSTKELNALAKQYPYYFEDPDVFFVVLRYFEIYKYRYTIRKFIIDLFNTNNKTLDTMVKRDKRRIKELLGR